MQIEGMCKACRSPSCCRCCTPPLPLPLGAAAAAPPPVQGTHDELLAREGGAYRSLALQQEPTLLQQLEAPPAAAATPLPAQSEPQQAAL